MHAHLVNFAGSSVFVARDPGFMALSLSLNATDFKQAMADLLDEIKSIVSNPPTLPELEKARTNMASEQYYFLETVDGLARKYGHYQDLFGDPIYFERFMWQSAKPDPPGHFESGAQVPRSQTRITGDYDSG